VTELFAPLRSRAYRWLEGTGLFANTGVWMVTLVGGFIMERLTTSPVLVTLAAAMSPLAGILAVVFSGAAADSRDRRAVLLVAKILLIASVAFLVLMSSSQLLTPATLLIGLAGMGIPGGTSSPSWWTTIAASSRPRSCPSRSAWTASSGTSARLSDRCSAEQSCGALARQCSSPSAALSCFP